MQRENFNNSENDLNGEDRKLESALSRLNPAAIQIDPQRLAFLAGRAQATRRLWMYRGVAAVMALAMGALVLLRPAPKVLVHERIVYVSEPAPLNGATEPAPKLDSSFVENLRIQQALLDHGLAALPPLPQVVSSRGLDNHVAEPILPN